MVILITGASHTGKTILAQKLLRKYSYTYLFIDHLKMGLIRSGNTNLTPYDDGQLLDYFWPIVREIIKTVIENKQNLIVEGGYIPFHWRRDFDLAELLIENGADVNAKDNDGNTPFQLTGRIKNIIK